MLSIENLNKIRINSSEDLIPSAEYFRDLVMDMCGFRIAACQNIAKNITLRTPDGELLATKAFGWEEEDSDSWLAWP